MFAQPASNADFRAWEKWTPRQWRQWVDQIDDDERGPYSIAEWVEWVEMMMEQQGLDRAGLDEATVAMPLTQAPPTPAVSEVPLAGASSDDSDGDGSSTYCSSLLTASTAPTWASTAPTLAPAQGQPAQGEEASTTPELVQGAPAQGQPAQGQEAASSSGARVDFRLQGHTRERTQRAPSSNAGAAACPRSRPQRGEVHEQHRPAAADLQQGRDGVAQTRGTVRVPSLAAVPRLDRRRLDGRGGRSDSSGRGQREGHDKHIVDLTRV